jgi:RHS repeat-associated protein
MTMTSQLSENSHQGFDGLKAALYLGAMAAKSNTAVGLPLRLRPTRIGSRSSGKERDAETGLDYFLARYYSGAQGRFLSVDPENAGAKRNDPQSWNAYAYSRNNPLSYTDPSGEAYEIMTGGSAYWYTDEEFAQKRAAAEGQGFSFLNDGSICKQYDGGCSYVGSYRYLGPDSILKSIFEKYLSFMNGIGNLSKKLDEHPEYQLALLPLLMMEGKGSPAAEAEAEEAIERVLGHFPGYIQTAEELGARYFSVPEKIWNAMTSVEQWAANQKFLDRGIAKGMKFMVDGGKSIIRKDSYLEREVNYLIQNGYTWAKDLKTLIRKP